MAKELTAQQRVATVMDAQNHDRGDVAHAVGVSESAIARWRNEDAYKTEVARLRETELVNLSSAIQRVREKLLDAAISAVKTLEDALEAQTEAGAPLWSTRAKAAEILITQAVPLVTPRVAGSEAGAASHASVTVIMNGDKDTVEGSAEEIE